MKMILTSATNPDEHIAGLAGWQRRVSPLAIRQRRQPR